MLYSYEVFHEKHPVTITRQTSLLPLFQILSDQFQVPYITLFKKNGTHVQLWSTYPVEWLSHYLNCKYHDVDIPLEEVRFNSLVPNVWGKQSLSTAQTEQIKIFREARDFRINSRFTVPILSPDHELTALTFATDEEYSVSEEILRSSEAEAFAASYMLTSMLPNNPASIGEVSLLDQKHASLSRLSHIHRKRRLSIREAILSLSYAAEEMESHIPTDYVNQFKYHASAVMQHLADHL